MAKPNGTEEGKGEVQKRILNAAEELFAYNSYTGARISEVAVKAGVNQALIHYYFQSKEGLYKAVLDRLFGQWERYMGGLSWEGLEPDQVVKQYILSHFQLKCSMPNFFNICQWGALEGGELFGRYASPQWFSHFDAMRQLFRQLKLKGLLLPQMNESVFLHALWGMTDHFYYRSHEFLQPILGHEGSVRKYQEEIADQLVRQTLYGVLPQAVAGSISTQRGSQGKTIVLQAVSGEDRDLVEVNHLLEAITLISGREAVLLHDELDIQGALRKEDLLFVLASTVYGEISEPIIKMLGKLQQEPSAIYDQCVGIWTLRDNPASEGLQRTLEDSFNRLGAFAVARVSNQTPRDYVRRLCKISGMS